MFRRSFKGKIILPAVVVMILLTVVLVSYVSVKFLHYSDTLTNEKLAVNIQLLRDYICTGQKKSQAAARSMACNPEAVRAIKNRDREKILEVFARTHEWYQINFYTITDEQGIVLVRTHDPDLFGDSILNQQNVRDALDGTVSTYFEAGTSVKVSVRTGAPVYDTDGTLIGIISAGVRFDSNEVVDALKSRFYSDVTVFFGGERITTTITDRNTGDRVTGTKLDPHVAEVVMNEQREYTGDVQIFSVKYKTFYMPLIDADGTVFAIFCIGTPMSELKKEASALIWNIIIISFIGLLVSIAILYWVISSISKPILELAKEMNKMEEGKLSLVIDANSNDEIGLAGKSLQKVANVLHKLIDDINVAISEHEKGNMDYRLDIGDFQGAYRSLANRIVKLSGLGMKDHLTGLPNRRSFHNRLEMEWGRTMRDHSPLSILILDIDNFKTYNDTYGHQQGDAVLQKVAEALPVPIKRGFDLAARWGGEEFVVLLPSTNSEGAVHVAEMIRAEIERAEVPSLDGRALKKVTVSIGVGTVIPSPEDSVEDLIARADEALYRAKKMGRNKVCRYAEG